jgi:hypothetical protein
MQKKSEIAKGEEAGLPPGRLRRERAELLPYRIEMKKASRAKEKKGNLKHLLK